MKTIRARHSPRVLASATIFAISVGIFLFALGVRSVFAEQLPVRIYTTTDGLPRDLILRIVRDSEGFLWFCTADGLSRFNGYDFTTYGIEQGLPHPVINDLLETRSGVYWIATNGGGVARFDPAPSQVRKLFTVFRVGESARH